MLKSFNTSGGTVENTVGIIEKMEKKKKIEDWTYEDVEYLIGQLPYPEVYGDVYGTGIQRENNINENKLVNMFQKRAGLLNEMDESPPSTSNLEQLAKKIKASIDSNDRFSIYVSKVISEPRSEKNPEGEFKYGSYAVRGGAADYIAKMLGLDFEGEGYGESTYTTIDKVMEALRTKKLIDLEW
jgi:hypothetical protein